MVALSKRLIDANGRTVTLIHQGQTPLDSAKPWRGLDTYHRARVSGPAVFSKSESTNIDNMKRERQSVLFAASNSNGEDLLEFDQIQDGGSVWKIESGELIGPANTEVIYKFEVSR